MGDATTQGSGGEQKRNLEDLSKDELIRFIRKLRDSHNALKVRFHYD